MLINVTNVTARHSRPLFAPADRLLTTVTVEFPEHDRRMTLDQWEGEEEWYSASMFTISNGYPHYCHGDGDRTVRKEVAAGPLKEAIEDAVSSFWEDEGSRQTEAAIEAERALWEGDH